MNFKDLVLWIRSQGCKVNVYKKKKKIDGCYGIFYEAPEPHIDIATKGASPRKMVSILLHEYAHFLQWRDGFSQYLDGVIDAHLIFNDWLDRYIELTEREVKMCRNTMLFIEYDADMRSFDLGMMMKPKNFDPDYHLRDAQSYANAIKWGWKHRKDWTKRVTWKKWPAKRLSHQELFAPLTKREKRILKKMRAKKR